MLLLCRFVCLVERLLCCHVVLEVVQYLFEVSIYEKYLIALKANELKRSLIACEFRWSSNEKHRHRIYPKLLIENAKRYCPAHFSWILWRKFYVACDYPWKAFLCNCCIWKYSVLSFMKRWMRGDIWEFHKFQSEWGK